MIVYLLRHGETEYNADGNRYCGRTDIDLTTKGIEQAVQISALLQGCKIDHVYSSPLFRAQRTAALATGYEPIVDERLIEIDFGYWEGKTKAEFTVENPQSWQKWMENPEIANAGVTGEKGQQVISRLNSFFDEMLLKHTNQNIVVVAHNGVNRLYLAHKLGMSLKHYRRILQENSALTIFEISLQEGFVLKKLNG